MSLSSPPITRRRRPEHGNVLGDGTALSISAIVTGVAGLLCWTIAAANLPQAAVGKASAFVSGFILVAGIAQLNVGLGLLRWLPRSGQRAGALLRRGYAVVAATAAVAATVFLILPAGHVAQQAAPRWSAALFVVASVCWAVFQLQDYVLASLGRARWVPLFNGAFGIARVAVLPALGAAFGAVGVLVSWIAPTVALTLAATPVIVAVVARARHTTADVPAVLPARREVLSFLGPTYLATIGTTVLYNSVPLLVVGRYGPVLGATFFIIWTGINAADYAVNGFVNSLVLRGSHAADAKPAILRAVARRLIMLVVPGALAGAAFAPVLLGLFGADYASQGTSALRVLLIGMVLRVVVALAIGSRLMAGDGKGAAAIQVSSSVLVLAGVLLAPLGAGLLGPAIGFVLAQLVVAGAALPGLLRRARPAVAVVG